MASRYRKHPDLVPGFERVNMLIFFSEKFLKLNNIDLEIEGYDNLPKNGGCLLVPNHKSNIDSVALLAALKDTTYEPGIQTKVTTFLAKKELTKKRLMRNLLSLVDTFAIDRSNFRQSVETINEFGKFVKENKTYGVVFPEGTRVVKEEIGEFKAGAFKVAQKEYLPVIPVTIKNSLHALDKKRKGRLKVTVVFHKVIKPSQFMVQDSKGIAQRVQDIVASKL
ncbi:lysophospholipid acyltransferase family protein [Mycoplasmopsis ciconiae]|uniref:Lysophospholipid acyltransferase family protein n=1 Tax=Mycoplasmopsis ciconiae TaxID=561067 RepID=A0ABU7MLY0_9BACT|nr:lysophospholipid acyltransferase family protein [Mycoplasmopsis ciconiae]